MSKRPASSARLRAVRVAAAFVAAAVMVVLTAGPAAAATGTIQIVRGGTGHGTITSTPAGIDCMIGPDGPSGTCEASFEEGTKVRLKAVAAPGSKFAGWAPTTSCPKANLTIRAGVLISCQPVFEFTEPPEVLLQALPEGSGTVAQSGGGLSSSCTLDVDAGTFTGVCAVIYPTGTVVTLTATAAAGWTFEGWRTETVKDKDDECADGIVTMDRAERCVAVFVRV